MLTFHEAREVVKKAEGGLWADKHGTFYVSDEGFQDKKHYLVVFGAEEWLIDQDPSYMEMDADIALVSRKDGKLTIATYLDDPDRFDAMRPIADQ